MLKFPCSFPYSVLLATALLLPALPASAEVVEVDGVAPMHWWGGPEFLGSVDRARKAAIQDAQNKLAVQTGTEIKESGLAKPGEIAPQHETPRPATAKKPGKVVILREWRDDNSFHVRIAVKTGQPNDAEFANQKYKGKITATPFKVEAPFQTGDIDDVAGGFQRELLRRLQGNSKFLTKASPYVIDTETSGANANNEAVKRIAGLQESRFVVSGSVLDADNTTEGGFLGFFQHEKRHFELDIFLYDGLTGTLVASHRISRFAIGDVEVNSGMSFGSSAFYSTTFGQAVNSALNAAADLIAWDTESIPFTARVIRVADRKIYIDAGGASAIASGDRLQAYLEKEFSITGAGRNSMIGAMDIPIGTFSIVQVQPSFSIGTLLQSDGGSNGGSSNVKVGDFLRFDTVDTPD